MPPPTGDQPQRSRAARRRRPDPIAVPPVNTASAGPRTPKSGRTTDAARSTGRGTPRSARMAAARGSAAAASPRFLASHPDSPLRRLQSARGVGGATRDRPVSKVISRSRSARIVADAKDDEGGGRRRSPLARDAQRAEEGSDGSDSGSGSEGEGEAEAKARRKKKKKQATQTQSRRLKDLAKRANEATEREDSEAGAARREALKEMAGPAQPRAALPSVRGIAQEVASEEGSAAGAAAPAPQAAPAPEAPAPAPAAPALPPGQWSFERMEAWSNKFLPPRHYTAVHRAFVEADVAREGRIHVATVLEDLVDNCSDSEFLRHVFAHPMGRPWHPRGNYWLLAHEFVFCCAKLCLAERRELIVGVFEMFTLGSNSGVIEEPGFERMVGLLGKLKLGGQNFSRALVREADKNGDGKLDLDEFQALNDKYPMLLYPVLQLRDQLIAKTLGKKAWRAARENYAQVVLTEEANRLRKMMGEDVEEEAAGGGGKGRCLIL